MENSRATSSSGAPATHTRPDPTKALAVAMGVCFILCFFRTGWPATPASLPHALQDRIDPNQASGSDLALLPGIGQVKAGAIVAFRELRREGRDSEGRVFATAADLQAVRGIGPKTVRRIAPYFRFE